MFCFIFIIVINENMKESTKLIFIFFIFRSLRQFQRKNTQGNSITESDTIPEDETIQSSTNNTKL